LQWFGFLQERLAEPCQDARREPLNAQGTKDGGCLQLVQVTLEDGCHEICRLTFSKPSTVKNILHQISRLHDGSPR
jgi:hypothetical protein